jgi:hypothetical protein
MTMLAQVADLAEYLGRQIPEDSARAKLILELLSATIEVRAGQWFSYVVDDDVKLRGTWGAEIQLPMRPVYAVSLVEIIAPGSLAVPVPAARWTVDALGKLELVRPVFVEPLNGAGFWGGTSSVVRVKYTHGYALTQDAIPNPNPLGVELLPEAIKGVCLSAASRAWSNPTAEAQESIGQAYSVTHGSPAGGIKLNDDELAIIDSWAMRV